MDILLGLFLIVFGVVIAFVGIQMFFFVLPLAGLVTGFYVGAEFVAATFGDGFLSTVAGWIVGIIVGIAFAAIARYWWYAGVLVSSGLVGALILSGIGEALGASSGFALFLFAAVGVVVFVIGTLMLNLPVYIVIVNTALSGSAIAITGAMLVLGQVARSDFAEGSAAVAINESWFWVLGWAILAGIGISRQISLKDRIVLPTRRWVPAV